VGGIAEEEDATEELDGFAEELDGFVVELDDFGFAEELDLGLALEELVLEAEDLTEAELVAELFSQLSDQQKTPLL
jgi:hypothetical protein